MALTLGNTEGNLHRALQMTAGAQKQGLALATRGQPASQPNLQPSLSLLVHIDHLASGLVPVGLRPQDLDPRALLGANPRRLQPQDSHETTLAKLGPYTIMYAQARSCARAVPAPHASLRMSI